MAVCGHAYDSCRPRVTVAIRSAESKEFVRGGNFGGAPASSSGFPANILVSSGRCLFAWRSDASPMGAPRLIYTVLEMAFGLGLAIGRSKPRHANRGRPHRAHASLGLCGRLPRCINARCLCRDGLPDVPRDRVWRHGIRESHSVCHSIVTIVVLLVFGGLTFLEAPRLQANLPTPWIVYENCVRYPPKPWGNRVTARMLSNLAAAKIHRPAHVTFRSPIPSHRWRQEERHVQMGTGKGIDKFEREWNGVNDIREHDRRKSACRMAGFKSPSCLPPP